MPPANDKPLLMQRLARLMATAGGTAARFLGDWKPSDPELVRRTRLITNFGFLGFLFGMAYAGFYWFIEHPWGSAIIVGCSLGFVVTPYLLRATHSIELCGHLLSGIMAAGFTALCGVEGGMNGHAIAWLVSVPLCALLLVGRKAGLWWTGISLLAAGAIVVAHMMGVPMPTRYDPKWHSLVTALGYLGLIAFMFLLGLIFESGRERAFDRMQVALGELESSNRQLIHLNQEKNEFLSIAAHDLKNPLTVIIGNAELIGMVEDRAKVEKLADRIHTAGTRMNTLIKDLLDANAIEEGRFSSKIEPCDMVELVEECERQNHPNAHRKQMTVRLHTGGNLWVRADRIATLQILDNLLSNAIKYSPLGSTVEVHILALGGFVLTQIRDQGPGLSDDDQTKLFRKFTRLSSKPTGGESSSGLGLSIVKRLAEAMAGSVECTSVFGSGSTFTLRLPAGEAPPNAVTAQVKSMAEPVNSAKG